MIPAHSLRMNFDDSVSKYLKKLEIGLKIKYLKISTNKFRNKIFTHFHEFALVSIFLLVEVDNDVLDAIDRLAQNLETPNRNK